MKIETLKERISKTEEKILKLNGTLERHQKQLEKKSKIVTDQGVNLTNYNKYDKTVINHDLYWDLCDYEHKLDDIESTIKRMNEASKSLTNLLEQLDNQLAKDKEVDGLVPQALIDFLEEWKQKCIKFYTNLAEEFIKLDSKDFQDYEITREELELLKEERYVRQNRRYENVRVYTDANIDDILKGLVSSYEIDNAKRSIRRRYIGEFRSSHFANDMAVVDKIVNCDEINIEMLNKMLDYDVKVKREMFIKRIMEVIGEIKDLSDLKIRCGELNGIAKGVKCNAKVETIGAGGYNIQCYHFRVLVNTIK